MADLVQLAIVYDTAQAAQRVQQLDELMKSLQANTDAVTASTKAGTAVQGVAGTALRSTGRAALILASSMQAGGLSAASMAGNLGRVASVLLGPWGIAIGIAIGVLTLLKSNHDKAREASEKFGRQLHDVSRSVDDLFRPVGKTPFESEIEHITDAMADLDVAINKAHASWLFQIRDFFATHGLHIPGLNITLFGGGNEPLPEEAQRNRLRGERARLTPEAERSALAGRTTASLNMASAFAGLASSSIMEKEAEQVGVLQDNLKRLLELGLDPTSAEALAAGRQLRELADHLRNTQRAAVLVRGGLQSMADALEEFVVTGTLAFQDFLNNILRMLYRDFTGELIHGLMRGAFSAGVGGSGGGGTQTTGGLGGGGGALGVGIATNVTFNVQAIDSQGVAQFFSQNGPQIAATVAGQASRSRAIRRRFLRS